MKATELMIDDWVLDKKKPVQITGIICDDFFETTLSPSIGGEYISPIPLTSEILKKNGFEECRIEEIEYYGWRLNEDFSLERNAVDTLIWNDDVPIHSVHQLQHALRLCGIEKEIEI